MSDPLAKYHQPQDHLEYLSHSQIMCYKECGWRYYLRYVIGIEPEEKPEQIHRGISGHMGLNLLARGAEFADVSKAVIDYFSDIPNQEVLCHTVIALLYAYKWRWKGDNFSYIGSEQQLFLPIYNSQGNASTRYGKTIVLDKLVQNTANGRRYLVDHKFVGTSVDIAPGSDYRDRFNLDAQSSIYLLAMRELGIRVDGFVYDLVRMPGIRPKKLAKADMAAIGESGMYFEEPVPEDMVAVYAEAATQKPVPEYVETPSMYGARVVATVIEDPERYFQRVYVHRTDRDLDEFADELWDDQKTVASARNTGRFPKNPNSCLFPYRCDYFGLCVQNLKDFGDLPDGFQKRKERENANTSNA